MAVEEIIFQYSTNGAKQAAKADSRVRDSVKETGKTANQETGRVNRWMTANKKAIQAVSVATAAAVGGLLSMSPTLRAELSGVRTAFTLFADTIVRDVLPGTGSLTRVALDAAMAYRDLDDGVRNWISALVAAVAILVPVIVIGGKLLGVLSVLIPSALTLGKAFGVLVAVGKVVVAAIAAIGSALAGLISLPVLIIAALAALLAAFILDIGGIRTKTVEFLGDMKDAFGTIWSETFDKAKEVLAGFRDSVVEWLGNVKDSFLDLASWLNASWVADLIRDARDWAVDVIKAFADRISLVVWRVGKAMRDVGSAIRDRATGWIDSAKGWGSDVIDYFVDGIRSAISRVRDVVSDIDNIIRDKLSFDITANDKMAQRWGSDFVEEWTDGFDSAASNLQNSVDSAQGNLTNLSGNSGGNGGGGTVIDLTFERGSIVMQGTGSTTRDAQNFVEETSSQFERKLGGRGL